MFDSILCPWHGTVALAASVLKSNYFLSLTCLVLTDFDVVYAIVFKKKKGCRSPTLSYKTKYFKNLKDQLLKVHSPSVCFWSQKSHG